MAAINDQIYAADYNRIQAGAANILGNGTKDINNSNNITYGYGQQATIASSQIVQLPNGSYPDITAAQWINLKSDLLRIANHQGTDSNVIIKDLSGSIFTGSISAQVLTITNISSGTGNIRPGQTVSGVGVASNTLILSQLNGPTGGVGQYQINVPYVTPLTTRTLKVGGSFVSGDEIKADHLNVFDSSLTLLANNRFNLGVGQYSDESLTTSSRTTAWKLTVRHFFTIDFGSANAARYFFNAGGSIRMTASRVDTPVVTKDTDWSNMLAAMGTIIFNHAGVTSSNSTGTESTIGFYNLTSVDQPVYSKSGSGTYQSNDYTITMSCDLPNGVTSNSQGQTSKIYVKIYFRDDAARPYDDNVTGTLTSEVRMYRPSGVNVSVTAPTATTTTSLSAAETSAV